MSQVPDLKEELDRKTTETMMWLMGAVQNGRITPAMFSVGLDVLFMSVAGLVGPDFIEMITAGQEACPKTKECVRRYFQRPRTPGLHRLTWIVGTDFLTRTRVIDGMKFDEEVIDCFDAKEAQRRLMDFSEEGLVEV